MRGGLRDFLIMTTTLPPVPDRSFASDNAAGAHPLVLEAITAANTGHALAYGADDYTRRCETAFCELFDADVATRLVFNGTGANVLALANLLGSMSGPHHAVVCTNWAHIATDETGAPERALSSKIIELDSADAKLTPAHIDSLRPHLGVQHHAQPGVVSITQATELGTLYEAHEIAAICDAAHELGLRVHLDGARIANATAALGASRAALRSFTIDAGVDAVSFGGTKNGLIGAEAVVFLNPAVATGADYSRKQVTQLASKMRFLAAQFIAMLDDDLWIDLAAHANAMATELHQRVAQIDGVDAGAAPAINSIFPRLAPTVIDRLREWSFFWDWDPSVNQVRWMTAWDTTLDDVENFAAGIAHFAANAGDTG